ncbi:hypothetical protein [Labilithrix luteola]|nr:hypothetical protein [Labilithrix luteola]
MPHSVLASRYVVVAAVLGGALFAACGSSSESMFSGGNADSGTNGSSGSSGNFVDPNGDGGTSPGTTVTALVFDPAAQTIVVDGSGPKTATYKLHATLPGGSVVDVSPESLQFDRPDLASAATGNPVTLTAGGEYAGTGKLHAIYGGVEALADLTVQIAHKDVGAGVTPTIQAALDAAGLGQDPAVSTFRYPYDKTVFPLGITSPLVMWDAPVSGDVYKLHLEQATYTYDLYATVNGLGQLRVDQTVWDRITASNTGDPLKVTLSRYSMANKTAYAAATQSYTIAPVSLRGAIYYWTASQLNGVRQGHIARIRPGSGSLPEPMSTGRSDQCMGCHAVSADGSTLAAAIEAAPTGDPATSPYTNGWKNGRAWASFDLPAGTVRKQTTMHGGNLALTPDGKYTVFGGRMQTNAQASSNTWQAGSKYMTLADTKTGDIVVASGLDDVQIAAGAGLAMPAFAPDGKHLAAVEFTGAANELRDNVLPNSVSIVIFGFDQATLKFTATPTRLPVASFAPYAATGIGYPSFTPNGKYVAFHVGNHSTGCFNDVGYGNCDDGTRHRGAIWYQATDGTGQPVRLAALDDPPAAGDKELTVEPTFNPVERGAYSWVVVTSMRDWGNKLTGAAINGKRRLWVAAIDTATGATDPSHPPFYLEGQEDSPNMRGFWTLAQCTPTPAPGAGGGQCSAGFECCSGFCDKGVCVDVSKIACTGIGGECTSSGDCCNPSSVSCVDGRCSANVVK